MRFVLHRQRLPPLPLCMCLLRQLPQTCADVTVGIVVGRQADLFRVRCLRKQACSSQCRRIAVVRRGGANLERAA